MRINEVIQSSRRSIGLQLNISSHRKLNPIRIERPEIVIMPFEMLVGFRNINRDPSYIVDKELRPAMIAGNLPSRSFRRHRESNQKRAIEIGRLTLICRISGLYYPISFKKDRACARIKGLMKPYLQFIQCIRLNSLLIPELGIPNFRIRNKILFVKASYLILIIFVCSNSSYIILIILRLQGSCFSNSPFLSDSLMMYASLRSTCLGRNKHRDQKSEGIYRHPVLRTGRREVSMSLHQCNALRSAVSLRFNLDEVDAGCPIGCVKNPGMCADAK